MTKTRMGVGKQRMGWKEGIRPSPQMNQPKLGLVRWDLNPPPDDPHKNWEVRRYQTPIPDDPNKDGAGKKGSDPNHQMTQPRMGQMTQTKDGAGKKRSDPRTRWPSQGWGW